MEKLNVITITPEGKGKVIYLATSETESAICSELGGSYHIAGGNSDLLGDAAIMILEKDEPFEQRHNRAATTLLNQKRNLCGFILGDAVLAKFGKDDGRYGLCCFSEDEIGVIFQTLELEEAEYGKEEAQIEETI